MGSLILPELPKGLNSGIYPRPESGSLYDLRHIPLFLEARGSNKNRYVVQGIYLDQGLWEAPGSTLGGMGGTLSKELFWSIGALWGEILYAGGIQGLHIWVVLGSCVLSRFHSLSPLIHATEPRRRRGSGGTRTGS